MRRLLLGLLVLLCAPLRAADVVRPIERAPVQLSLDFSARPAVPTAVPIVPAAALSAVPAALPAQAVQAVAAAQPVQRPAKPAVAAAKAAASGAAPFDGGKPQKATKLDYEEFGRLVGLTPRLSTSPFRDTEAKRRILMKSGYTHLIGPKGKRIPLPIADELRVGKAFENTLRAHARRQAKAAK